MALDNLISVEFSSEELKKINDALAFIEEVMRGKTINLSPEERQQYGRIADRNKVLVDKCKTYMEQYALSLPPTLDKAEFERNLISERTKIGLEGARRRNKHLGRPKGVAKETLEKYQFALHLYENKNIPIDKVCKQAGLSKTIFYRVEKGKLMQYLY